MARFLLNERIIVRHLPTLPPDPLLPSLATDLAAGTNLIGATSAEELEDISGFEPSPSTITMGGYASIKEGTLPGPQSYGDSRLSFYMDDTIRAIYSLFPGLSTGFLSFAQDGEVVGADIVIFPYSVGSRVRRPARNVAAQVDVNFAIQVEYEGVIAP